MTPRWMLRCFRWAYCAFITAASFTTAMSAHHELGVASHRPQLLLALAGTETLAALAFAIEPIEVVACAVLLVVYSIAGVVSVLSMDWTAVLRFIFYGAATIYIVFASRRDKLAVLRSA